MSSILHFDGRPIFVNLEKNHRAVFKLTLMKNPEKKGEIKTNHDLVHPISFATLKGKSGIKELLERQKGNTTKI